MRKPIEISLVYLLNRTLISIGFSSNFVVKELKKEFSVLEKNDLRISGVYLGGNQQHHADQRDADVEAGARHGVVVRLPELDVPLWRTKRNFNLKSKELTST